MDEKLEQLEILNEMSESSYPEYKDRRLIGYKSDQGKIIPKYSPLERLPKIGRNESCPCGSGLKFKRCKHEG